jgi:hypothetical protein
MEKNKKNISKCLGSEDTNYIEMNRTTRYGQYTVEQQRMVNRNPFMNPCP